MLGWDSLILYISTNAISFGVLFIIFCFTVLNFRFITGLYLITMFYHFLVVAFCALFWLAFSKANEDTQYLFMVCFYIFVAEWLRIGLYPLYTRHKQKFMIVGANAALVPTTNFHIGFATGLAFATVESIVFFSMPLILQPLGYLRYNTALYPPITSYCGVHDYTTGFTPIPLSFPTALFALSIIIINIIVSLCATLYTNHVETSRKRVILHFSTVTLKLMGGFLGPFLIASDLATLTRNNNRQNMNYFNCYTGILYPILFIIGSFMWLGINYYYIYPISIFKSKNKGNNNTNGQTNNITTGYTSPRPIQQRVMAGRLHGTQNGHLEEVDEVDEILQSPDQPQNRRVQYERLSDD